MKVIELFAGTMSIWKVAKALWHEVFSSDNDPQFKTDYTVDVMEFDTDKVPFIPDVIWASPPCTAFSIAACYHHWHPWYVPKTEGAILWQKMVIQTLNLIDYYKVHNPNLIWFIENPRGMLRKMPFMEWLPRKTVTYCQYWDTRMKPTDLWTNSDWTPRPMCKNWDPCHVAAPRWAKTWTQGLKWAVARSVIPPELPEEIFKHLWKQI